MSKCLMHKCIGCKYDKKSSQEYPCDICRHSKDYECLFEPKEISKEEKKLERCETSGC